MITGREAGQAAGFGGKPRPSLKLRRWTRYRNDARTMIAFFSVELASGSVINDLRLMIGQKGSRWVAMPSKQRERSDGGKVWDDYDEFRDKTVRERFQDLVLELLREHPEFFDG